MLRAPPTNNRENAHTAPTQKDQSSYPSLSLSPFLFAFHRNRRNINIWKGKIYTLLGAQTNLWRKCRATAETLARATTGLLLLRWVPLSRKARKKKKHILIQWLTYFVYSTNIWAESSSFSFYTEEEPRNGCASSSFCLIIYNFDRQKRRRNGYPPNNITEVIS